jgi:glycosyltransferase involved in cell wall biosynthesis
MSGPDPINPAAPIAYDMIRLFLGPISARPRGIDRVDVAYARFFAENWPGEFGGILPTICGFRWFERAHVLKWIDRLESLWSESIDPDSDPVLRQIKRRLAGDTDSLSWDQMPRSRSAKALAGRIPNIIRASGLSIGRNLGRSLPKGALYINVGQLGMAMQWLLGWLERRPDVKPVFMLHDVIPIESPDLVSARTHHYHGRMVDNAVRYAAGLITTTEAARVSVMREFGLRGNPGIPVETSALPVAPCFRHRGPPDPELAQHRYFVICGAIEPRKNHLLLLNVWRDLVKEHGRQAPRLIVVGSPGWGSAPILHTLSRCKTTRDHIVPACGLSTPALRSLLANATALLMPSFAEGFGLPVIEALSVGTPVIASDLPAHREAAGDFAIYHDPIDGLGWLNQIQRFTFEADQAEERRRHIASYRPLTSDEYFARIGSFLGRVHGNVGIPMTVPSRSRPLQGPLHGGAYSAG